jgi:hypothetical protein
MFAMFFKCFQVFQMHVSSISSIFFLYVASVQLDVSKVDQMLHMRSVWEVGGGANGPCVGAGDAGAVE